MSKIAAPTLPDRVLLCQEALGAEFLSLGDRAHQAGWLREEVAMAITELADNYFLMDAVSKCWSLVLALSVSREDYTRESIDGAQYHGRCIVP
ncbi:MULTISPECIES: hypothetical protein [unclassified Ensifer]|uniref:hypothetical protein n=1 Tax=unclassified Ensifer TaxID=2633371 RepID=UPI00070955DC|nr:MULTISPECIES: hypothetical protein [unclassified Ensifer]KQW34948.1 hypothetical protein ASD02_17240 [Ensifer sp. Root1252]KRC57272.1 hypothetical protein ASE32_20555 [Ensifer sp. Root231]KRC87767.1 hypothetical protein ASE47_14710 [Ensifer sp. Root258]